MMDKWTRHPNIPLTIVKDDYRISKTITRFGSCYMVFRGRAYVTSAKTLTAAKKAVETDSGPTNGS